MLNEMKARKIAPTIYSYAAAVSACERSGQWKASLDLLDRMQAAGVSVCGSCLQDFSCMRYSIERGGVNDQRCEYPS